jgi:hypothetical protein
MATQPQRPACRGALASFALAVLAFWTASAQAEAAVDFDRDVRPVLSDHCFRCHGPDPATRKAGLRLDTREGLFALIDGADGKTRAGVAPGHPESSELFLRVSTTDPDDRMPPAKWTKTTGKAPTAAEIATLRDWIREGAAWRGHWAFEPVTRPALPETRDRNWPRNAIDHLVAQRLEKEGLAPSPPAPRPTLLRRLALDLTGLPPSLKQVEAFTRDRGADAYERAVDRLLATPEYGEHMARLWMDLARYGDTHGLHRDERRSLWPYRDWVIAAFNRNMPFDQFTIEQLAGDLLPRPTVSQRVATGFVRGNASTSEGGAIGDEWIARYAADRAETVATTWMGLTVGCAACHDHKYDPVTQKDFYQLTAYFRAIDEDAMDENRERVPPFLRLPSPGQDAELKRLDAKIARLQARVDGPWASVDRAQAAWEREVAGPPTGGIRLSDWSTLGCFDWGSVHESWARAMEFEGHPIALDRVWTSQGRSFSWTSRREWMDGRVTNGLQGTNCATYLWRRIDAAQARQVKLSLGGDDGIKVWLNGKILREDLSYEAAAADQLRPTAELRAGTNEVLVKIVNHREDGAFFFALEAPDGLSDAAVRLLRLPRTARTPEQIAALRAYYRYSVANAADLTATKRALADARAQRRKGEDRVAITLVAADRAQPRPTFVLERGQYDRPQELVGPNTPAALPPLPALAPHNRLGLARWLVSPEHPLTARVTVNRLWQQLFGTGLVRTSEDFGLQGERPSHPELLDWLAAELVQNGWDLQHMLRLMVTSATYRQASATSAQAYERDPENRWLARGPRFRLDAEGLRDQALSIGGLLVRKLGGPSVKPPQPPGLWEEVSVPNANTSSFKEDTGPAAHRRSLYSFWKRTAPPPAMTTFDAPSRESCTARRERTNTPLQALVLLNEPQMVAAAQALAERALRDGRGDPEAAVTQVFRRATLRDPDAREREMLNALLQSERQARHGDDRAALTVVANLVLNLDEVVTKE